jgi:DNA ligase-associated metallophosphoesterase
MPVAGTLHAVSLSLNGAEILADLTGAIFWPARRTVAVADLHLEKGSSFARHGSHLPPYDSRATLDRLADVVDRYRPERVICVGDSFHDRKAADRLAQGDADRLRQLTGRCDWTWICGNHDAQPPTAWGGRIAGDLALGPLVFRHEAFPRPVGGEVSGHFHPKAGLPVRGRHVGGRCFVTDGRRLILPAFGAYAGGLDVRDPAIATLFPNGFRALLIGRDKLHRLAFESRDAGAPDAANRRARS